MYFLADNYTRTEQRLEPGENIATVEVINAEARDICLDGRISEERSALTPLRFLEGKLASNI